MWTYRVREIQVETKVACLQQIRSSDLTEARLQSNWLEVHKLLLYGARGSMKGFMSLAT